MDKPKFVGGITRIERMSNYRIVVTVKSHGIIQTSRIYKLDAIAHGTHIRITTPVITMQDL